MVILAKLFLAGAIIAIIWGTIARFAGHNATGAATWPQDRLVLTVVLSGLSLSFWLSGRLSVYLGKGCARGIRLP
jgi:hypothetical protein